MNIARSRIILSNVLVFGGAAGFVFALLWPLVRLAIPGPLYHLSAAILVALVAFVLGIVGCTLEGEFRNRFEGFVGLSIAGVLLLSGTGAFCGLLIGDPVRIVSRDGLVAAIMALCGGLVVFVLRKDRRSTKNVT